MELREVPIDEMDVGFERFRFVDPRADARMIASMKTYGQLSPVITGSIEKKVVLVDGYKRFRAAKALHLDILFAYTVARSMIALKAIALNANREQSPCRELEEALLVQSLHRDDGLQQNEIAALCHRNKSWVCRRIALIERLSEDVREQLRLGLLTISSARELLRLPRGNQQEVLRCLLDNRLSSRQCRELVQSYLTVPQWQRKKLLQQSCFTEQWRIDCGCFTFPVLSLLRSCNKLATTIRNNGIGSLNDEQRRQLHRAVQRVGSQCSSIITMLPTSESEP